MGQCFGHHTYVFCTSFYMKLGHSAKNSFRKINRIFCSNSPIISEGELLRSIQMLICKAIFDKLFVHGCLSIKFLNAECGSYLNLYSFQKRFSVIKNFLIHLVWINTSISNTISDKNYETRTPLPFVHCWLQVYLLIPGHHCLA